MSTFVWLFFTSWMKYGIKWLEIKANRLCNSLFILLKAYHDHLCMILVLDYIWSSHGHPLTITNYQFISMNTNNAVAWGHLFSVMLNLYSKNPSIFVLKLFRVSSTINDNSKIWNEQNTNLTLVNITSDWILGDGENNDL